MNWNNNRQQAKEESVSDITVKFSISEFGCLKGVLFHRILEVKRHMEICGDKYTEEDRQNSEAFIKQMEGCLSVINRAREDIMNPKPLTEEE